MRSFIKAPVLYSAGQADGKGGAAVLLALRGDLSAAQLDDPVDQGQPQTVPCGGAGRILLVEFVKNMPDMLRADPDPLVPYPDGDEGVLFLRGNMDDAALMAEFYRVADEVQPHQVQHFCIVPVGQPRQVHVKGDAAGHPLVLQTQDAGAKLLVQCIVRLFGHQLLIFVFGKQQHAGRQIGQPLRFLGDEFQVFLLLLRRQLPAAQPFGKAADGADGRFEFVGKDVDKVIAHQLCTAQLRRHPVEAAQKLRHISLAGFLHPDGVVAPGDGLRGLHHVLDGLCRTPADGGGNGNGHQERQDQGNIGRQEMSRRENVLGQGHPHEHGDGGGKDVGHRDADDKAAPGRVKQFFQHSRTAL